MAKVKRYLYIESPELFKQIYPSKNEGIDLFSITCMSHKKIWWSCTKGHKWKAEVKSRLNGCGCKKCNNKSFSFIERRFYYYLQLVFPKSINTHHIIYKNKKIEIDIFIPEINLAIEYDGRRFHIERQTIIRDKRKNLILKRKKIHLLRIRDFGLPKIHSIEFVCDYKNKNSFSITLFKILDFISKKFKLSNKQKNKIKKIKNTNVDSHVIPIGFFKYPTKENSLAKLRPDLSKEWHLTKNGDLKPEHVSCFSHKKVWWIDKNGHERT